ncbi:MAG TPA: O-antigen ligase family protein [Candidatus Didemnitutus sp.]|nr:O-antigen ligase family protein [Candidatus Didemnitutus sp.]
MTPRPSGPATSIVRYALLAAIAGWVVLSLIPRGATLIYLWPWPAVLAASLFAPIGVWLAAIVSGRAARLGGAADWAVAAALLATSAAALASPFRETSVRALLLPLAATSVIYLLTQRLRKDPAVAERAAQGLAILLAAFTMVSLGLWWWLVAGPMLEHTAAVNRAAGTAVAVSHLWEARNPHPFGHSNYVAGALLLLLPWGVSAAWIECGAKRYAWTLVVAAALFCLFTTGSRAAIIGLAAFAAATGVLLVRSRKISFRVAVIGVGLGLVGAAIFAAANPRVLGLLRASPAAATNDGDRQRTAMLQAGAQMTRARPIVGWGPGTTPLVYPRFRAQLTGGVDTALQLHSTPAQLLADSGALGLATILFLVGCAAVAWWRRCAADGPLVPQVAGLALAGYGAFALFDYQLDVPFFALIVAALLALLFATSSAAQPTLPRWRPSLVLALVAGAILWFSIPAWRAQSALAGAAAALESGDSAEFDRLAQEAAAISRTDTVALNALAMQHGERALRASTTTEQAALAKQAANFFAASLLRNQDQELCLTNLAWLQLRTDPKVATPYFLAAAKLVPDKEGLYLGLAYSLLADGHRTSAVYALALECLVHPAFLQSPHWRDNALAPLREAALARVAERATDLVEKFPNQNWNRTELIYLATFARWLAGKATADEVRAVASIDERRRFFSEWAKPDAGLVPPSRDALPRHYLAQHYGPPDDAWLDAMREFAALSPAAQREHFRDPTALPVALVALTRAQRVGYGVLMKNLDTPMPVDFYYAQHNRLMEDFFDFLFPSQLRLPGPLVLAELDAVTR